MNINLKKKKKIIIDEKYQWKNLRLFDEVIWYTGNKDFVYELFIKLNRGTLNLDNLESYLFKKNRNTSVIFLGKKFCLCFTDLARSFPIFFQEYRNNLVISNNSNLLNIKNNKISVKALKISRLCGYVLGHDTLYRNIKIMKPGEFFFSYRNKNILKQYFIYHRSYSKKNNNIKDLKDKLNSIIDQIFNEISIKYRNKDIWVPISGGLDSRLILAKLHEKKIKNLKSFSYGMKNNSDAMIGKKVAQKLNIPWVFINIPASTYRYFNKSNLMREFIKFSDNHQVIPNVQDFLVIKKMKEDNILNKKSIIINGQSGDFNTGNHIPKKLIENKDYKTFLDSIKRKHFFLIKKDENQINDDLIESELEYFRDSYLQKKLNLVDLYEEWEFEERQVKYVVNGQRVYDFFKLDWALPLWDSLFVKFWTTVPEELRFGQRLYKLYLSEWDYQSLFSSDWRVTAFTGNLNLFIKMTSFILNFVNPIYKKENILQYFDYFSRYGFAYKYFGFFKFILKRHCIKNASALHILSWLDEKGFKN